LLIIVILQPVRVVSSLGAFLLLLSDSDPHMSCI
jgi:hypothetical protein